jgi:DNA-binding transcriptional MocR family regulator
VVDRLTIKDRSAAEIVRALEREIDHGRLRPGDLLPPVRRMAEQLGVSPVTVAAAYRTLSARGLVTGAGRRGTSVTARAQALLALPDPPVPPGVRNLAHGNPDPELLPSITPALGNLPAKAGLYGGRGCLPELAELAATSFTADGLQANAIAVVAGALDGIERVLAIHTRPGDRVAVEDPGFPRLLDLASMAGLVPVPVTVDDRGPQPESLQRALAQRVAACIVTPRAQNPTGACLDAGRATELRTVLSAYPDVLLIEDDYVGAVAGVGYASLAQGGPSHWCVARSMSKVLGPDLRVAILAGDQYTVRQLTIRQRIGTGWVSHILQSLVTSLLQDPRSTDLLDRATRTYDSRRQELVSALHAIGVQAHGVSGLNVWIPVANETLVARRLLEGGFAVATGERFRLSTPPAIRVTTADLRPGEADRIADLIAGDTRALRTLPA